MNQQSDKQTHRIDDALNVAPLIVSTLEQLSVSTIRDLLSLELESVRSIKGVGVAKVDAVIDAIEQARIYSGEQPDDSSEDYVPDAVESRELIFVPSLLRNTFKQHEITHASHLFRLVPRELENQSGWGDKKIKLVARLQRLHRVLDEAKPDTLVADVVPDVLLPETSIGELTIQAFVDEQASSRRLTGAKSEDYVALKLLLSTVTSSHGDATCLHGFADTELHWRDVPLKFSGRIVKFLDDNLIESLDQLDELASLGRCANRNGKSITAEGHDQFGDTSRNELRQKLRALNRAGLSKHQRQVCCSLDDLPDSETRWDEIPIQFPGRLKKFLNDHGLHSIKQVHAFAIRQQLRDAESGEWKDASSVKNFSERSLRDLRSELKKLADLGLDEYRFGEAGRPESIGALIDAVKNKLLDGDFEALMLRAQGLTLEEIGERIGLSRERARQLAKRAVENGSVYTSVARGFLEPVIAELKSEGVLSLVRAATLLKCKESSTIRFLAIIAEYEYEINDRAISLFDGIQRRALEGLLRHQLKNGELPQENGNIVLRKLLPDAPKKHVKPIEPVVKAGIDSLSIVAACRLTGKKWLSGYIGSQLVAAGVNGLFFDEIDTGGSFDSATELKEFLKDTADVLHDGRFRRANDIYRSGDEILGFLRNSSEPLSTPQLIEMSSQKWFQSHLNGRYLSPLYEAILIDRGLYVHAENLNLSVRDVKRIANWGAELLHGEKTSVSAEVLLELFQESDLGLSVETPYQLVSIIAKHPDVKRLSNNLQLAHKDFFDDSELYLAASDPDLAAQWHPEKNGTTKPEKVRPTTTTVYWWRCEKGHEFQASAVYRTRSIRSCPGCQERWNLAKIRHFVRSLRDHLETLTPAELYVIFQQSGLWQKRR